MTRVLLAALLLVACGSEVEPAPAPPVVMREVCTVRLFGDGRVQCTCEVVP
ncbi:MAG: hypothetical protein WCS72_19090 [Deltaproteobacteria bacterium]